jgi:hypothetical protein
MMLAVCFVWTHILFFCPARLFSSSKSSLFSHGQNSDVPDPNNQPKDRRFEAALKQMLHPETPADVLVISLYPIAIAETHCQESHPRPGKSASGSSI